MHHLDEPYREQIARWREELREIQRVARRKRLLGQPDHVLEAGIKHLEQRLAAMREEGARGRI
jgi:hypothetical protein